MSRRIKTYPFNQMFNDELVADADSIKDLKLPGAYVKYLSLATGRKDVLSLRTQVYALEESKGVHLCLVEEDKNGNETGKKSEEVIIDEVQFCDAIHDAVCNQITIEETPFIRDIITKEIERYAQSQISGDQWLTTINYDGYGAIMSGDSIIGTVDRTVFEDDHITLDQCVGNLNLNNVENCSIVFKTGNKGYRLFDIKMKGITSVNNFYCTYTIGDYKGEFLTELPINEEQFKDLIRYSDDTAEEFLSQRISIIDSEEEKEEQSNSLYDDIL